MNYYQEITLLPDATLSLDFLWQKVYQQVHIALADNKVTENRSAIAVAFPDYGCPGFRLGRRLRLLAGTQEQLTSLNIQAWLSRLTDYVHIRSIQAVPEKNTPVSYLRVHVKGRQRIEADMQEKARRWAAKSGQSVEQCLKALEASKPKARNRLPFIWAESQQSKSRENPHRPFPLFIRQLVFSAPQPGAFTCYGLSLGAENRADIATVPHF